MIRTINSVQFSRSVVSDSSRPHELQHARPPCPSPTPGVHSNSCPLSQRCHPAISSSVVPFSSCPQSLPASESFPVSQLFTLGGQSTGVSPLASFLPKKSQGWSPLEWTKGEAKPEVRIVGGEWRGKYGQSRMRKWRGAVDEWGHMTGQVALQVIIRTLSKMGWNWEVLAEEWQVYLVDLQALFVY